MGGLLVKPMRPQNILQPQELDVRAERHFSRAIRVKVELVLDDFGEMAIDFVTLLERVSELTLALIGQRGLRLIPHALHLVEVLGGGHALPRELLAHFRRLGHFVSSHQVLGALAVDVPIGRVKALGLIQTVNSLFVVAHVLEDLALEHEQLDQGRGVLDGLVDDGQRAREVFLVVVVLSHVVEHPQEGGGRLLVAASNVFAIERAVGFEVVVIACQQVLDDADFARVSVERPEIDKEWRHTLAERLAHVLVRELLEEGTYKKR